MLHSLYLYRLFSEYIILYRNTTVLKSSVRQCNLCLLRATSGLCELFDERSVLCGKNFLGRTDLCQETIKKQMLRLTLLRTHSHQNR